MNQPVPVADPPVYVITAAEFRMRCVAGWIEQYRKTHGHAPRLTEIGTYAGLTSSGTAMRLVVEMNNHGFLRQEPRKSRAAEVLEGPALGSVERPPWTDPRLRGWRPGEGEDHSAAWKTSVTQREQVLNVLRGTDGTLAAREIVARTGIHRRTVSSLLSQLRDNGTVCRLGRGAWCLARSDVPA